MSNIPPPSHPQKSWDERQMRGLCQGRPLSVLLYMLYVEPLACAIRESPDITGIQLPGGETLKI